MDQLVKYVAACLTLEVIQISQFMLRFSFNICWKITQTLVVIYEQSPGAVDADCFDDKARSRAERSELNEFLALLCLRDKS